MTEEEIKAARALCEAHAEVWDGESDDWRCRGCYRSMYLAPELEPCGLCEECLEKLIAEAPRLLDEVERLRAENEALDAQLQNTQADYGAIEHERDALRAEVEQYKRAKAENDERFMLERDAARTEVEKLRAALPTCDHCEQRPATCLGCYEDHARGDCGDCAQHDEAYACDECCGHGNEDGHCWPLQDVAGVLTTVTLNADALRAEIEPLRVVCEAARAVRHAWLSMNPVNLYQRETRDDLVGALNVVDVALAKEES